MKNSDEPLPTPITNEDEYRAARKRMRSLFGCLEGSPEEDILLALSAAIELWEQEHPPTTGRFER